MKVLVKVIKRPEEKLLSCKGCCFYDKKTGGCAGGLLTIRCVEKHIIYKLKGVVR